MVDSLIKRTPLYNRHKEEGAKFIEFAGFSLPLQFTSTIEEHLAVRNNVGLFDVSHMGEIEFSGKDALSIVNYLCTNDLAILDNYKALYTPFCNEEGGILDDCVVYRFSPERVMVVVNAANREKMYNYFLQFETKDCKVIDLSDEIGQVALQGPFALNIMEDMGLDNISSLPNFGIVEVKIDGINCIISRTGYTGEDGFEIYCDSRWIEKIWNMIIDYGKKYNIKLCGLGARDTLRLEAKLCLYGNDIDETTSPLEAGIGWTVKFDKGEFVGKRSLLKQKQEGLTRKLIGFKMVEKAIPRHSYEIFSVEGEKVGYVTSGSYSPYLKENIGLGYLSKECWNIGSEILINIRGQLKKGVTVKTPFYKRKTFAPNP